MATEAFSKNNQFDRIRFKESNNGFSFLFYFGSLKGKSPQGFLSAQNSSLI